MPTVMSFHVAAVVVPPSSHGEAITHAPKITLTKRTARPTSASAMMATVRISAPTRWLLWAAPASDA